MKSTCRQKVNLSTSNEFCWCCTQQWEPTGSFGGVVICPSISPGWLGISTGPPWSTTQPIATKNHHWKSCLTLKYCYFSVCILHYKKSPLGSTSYIWVPLHLLHGYLRVSVGFQTMELSVSLTLLLTLGSKQRLHIHFPVIQTRIITHKLY